MPALAGPRSPARRAAADPAGDASRRDRRRTAATRLLSAIVKAALAADAPGVEAYPVDPEGHRIDAGFGYVGLASMFDAAGFRRVLLSGARSAGLPRWLVRLDFRPPPA